METIFVARENREAFPERLAAMLSYPPKGQVEESMKGHILAHAELVGLYRRKEYAHPEGNLQEAVSMKAETV